MVPCCWLEVLPLSQVCQNWLILMLRKLLPGPIYVGMFCRIGSIWIFLDRAKKLPCLSQQSGSGLQHWRPPTRLAAIPQNRWPTCKDWRPFIRIFVYKRRPFSDSKISHVDMMCTAVSSYQKHMFNLLWCFGRMQLGFLVVRIVTSTWNEMVHFNIGVA